ncbi:MAG: hypothetical protein ABL871_12930 [Terricaulis sp.]
MSPLDSIGPLKLGAARSRIRDTAAQLGLELKHVTETADYFTPEASIQVEYDNEDRAWFIGINATPSRFRVLFDGVDLFTTDATGVFDLFDKHEGNRTREPEPNGFTFDRQIVALWKDDPDSAAWSQIAIGTPKYLTAVQEVMGRP